MLYNIATWAGEWLFNDSLHFYKHLLSDFQNIIINRFYRRINKNKLAEFKATEDCYMIQLYSYITSHYIYSYRIVELEGTARGHLVQSPAPEAGLSII